MPEPTFIDPKTLIGATFADADTAGGTLVPSEHSAETLVEGGLDGPPLRSPERAAQKTTIAGRTVLPRVERGDTGTGLKLVHQERDRYESRKSLGTGGMGEVKLAHDHDIDRPVAIKRLHPEMRRPAVLSRFVGEVRTIGQLEHPNIIPIHDVGVDPDGGYFFVMKYLEGETLEGVIERLKAGDPDAHRTYTFEKRAEIIKGVLRALHYAHTRNIIHRDIKPANVMIGKYGEIVLMDWGIARTIGSAEPAADPEEARMSAPATIGGTTRIGSLIGTPLYMSPEQIRGEHDRLAAQSDLYSVGVMFFELLTLQHPLQDCADLDVIRAAVQERVLFNKVPEVRWHANQKIPPPAEYLWLCWRAVQKDVDKRFSSAQAMLDEFRRIDEGQCQVDCIFTLTKRMTREASRFSDRNPMVGFLSMILLFCLIVLNILGAGVLATLGVAMLLLGSGGSGS